METVDAVDRREVETAAEADGQEQAVPVMTGEGSRPVGPSVEEPVGSPRSRTAVGHGSCRGKVASPTPRSRPMSPVPSWTAASASSCGR